MAITIGALGTGRVVVVVALVVDVVVVRAVVDRIADDLGC